MVLYYVRLVCPGFYLDSLPIQLSPSLECGWLQIALLVGSRLDLRLILMQIHIPIGWLCFAQGFSGCLGDLFHTLAHFGFVCPAQGTGCGFCVG